MKRWGNWQDSGQPRNPSNHDLLLLVFEIIVQLVLETMVQLVFETMAQLIFETMAIGMQHHIQNLGSSVQTARTTEQKTKEISNPTI